MDEPLLPIDTGTPALRGTARAAGRVPLAEVDPVALVLVDHPVPHLARGFDYAVPKKFADTALPGVRVRVKFAGRLRDGYVLERRESSEHVGELSPIERITSPLRVLTPELLELCESVAARYAGTLPDVLRLAIPPRHAGAERAVLAARTAAGPGPARETTDSQGSAAGGGTDSASGPAETGASAVLLLARRIVGELATISPVPIEAVDASTASTRAKPHPRMALSFVPGPLPGLAWILEGVRAASRTLSTGESVLWLVPDHRELAVLAAVLDELVADPGLSARLLPGSAESDGPGTSPGLDSYLVLNSDQSPADRWTNWLRGHLGDASLLIGTRAACFAPLPDLGLIICLEDENQNYLDQHAPYPHAREVCLLRSNLQNTGLLFLSSSRSPEIQRLCEIGWLAEASPDPARRRAGAPLVFVPDEERDAFAWQRIPSRAFALIQQALRPRAPKGSRGNEATARPGPVLIQVPRGGYYPVFACARCQEVARCPRCEATLSTQSEIGPFACRKCGHHCETFTCGRCRSHQVRSIVRGRSRTVEELRRAMPGVEILESGGDSIPVAVDDSPRIVVATTGAEPYALGGYATAVLLDSLWPGPWMRSSDESVSRRLRAASLVRSREDGGAVWLGDPDEAIRSALVAFDPVGYMSRQLVDRHELGFPPFRRIVEFRGSASDIDVVLAEVAAAVSGPAADPEGVDAVLTELIREDEGDASRSVSAFPIAAGPAVGTALAAVTATRSAKRKPQVTVRIDDPRSL